MKTPPSDPSSSPETERIDASPALPPPSLGRMTLEFLKIGTLGFGGGMAVLPLVEHDCVLKHHCIEAEEFLHGVGLGQILGPFVVNASIFIGYRLFGLLGGLIAATAFMTPSVLMVIGLSRLYFTYHEIPSLDSALIGLGPVVIALIVSACWSLGQKSLRTAIAWALAVGSCVLSVLHVNALAILGGAALMGVVLKLAPAPAECELSREPRVLHRAVIPLGVSGKLTGLGTTVAGVNAGPATVAHASYLAAVPLLAGLVPLAWVFLQIGVAFFGGGFVLIPILYNKMVLGLGWLTQKEFLEGVAISQLTPGPVAVLATFVGYKVAGVAGALVATLALFTPATILMFFIAHFYKRLRNVQAVQHLLSGITPTVVGMIGAAAVSLAPGSLHLNKPLGWLLCAASLLLLVRWKWHPALVLLIGVVSGILMPGLI